jgi:hypothetical protein
VARKTTFHVPFNRFVCHWGGEASLCLSVRRPKRYVSR